MNQIELDITPVAKPRMTRRDQWKNPPKGYKGIWPRPVVSSYRAFKTEIALKKNGFYLPDSYRIVFFMPMPKSWSEKKRNLFEGQPHKQVPDLDNLIKAVNDAFKVDDSEIYQIEAVKVWWTEGKMTIKEI
jgi:Holliday junction resolvase RusA-like endonuclease